MSLVSESGSSTNVRILGIDIVQTPPAGAERKYVNRASFPQDIELSTGRDDDVDGGAECVVVG